MSEQTSLARTFFIATLVAHPNSSDSSTPKILQMCGHSLARLKSLNSILKLVIKATSPLRRPIVKPLDDTPSDSIADYKIIGSLDVCLWSIFLFMCALINLSNFPFSTSFLACGIYSPCLTVSSDFSASFIYTSPWTSLGMIDSGSKFSVWSRMGSCSRYGMIGGWYYCC